MTDIPIQPGETAVTASLRRLADSIPDAVVIHTTDGVHATNSLHYVGRAVDLDSISNPTGWDAPQLDAIAAQILARMSTRFISEFIWAGPHPIYIKNGVFVNGLAVYGAAVIANHHDHIHLAATPDFTWEPPMPNPPTTIIAFVATPTGLGYHIVFSDGAIFAFGDARYYGRPKLDATGVWQVVQ